MITIFVFGHFSEFIQDSKRIFEAINTDSFSSVHYPRIEATTEDGVISTNENISKQQATTQNDFITLIHHLYPSHDRNRSCMALIYY